MKKVLAVMMAAVMAIGTGACSGAEAPKERAAESTAASTAAQEPEAETSAEANEAAWPERDVSIIVGANPGGGQDTVARLYAKYLTQETGKTFNVVNVSGGNGSTASTQVKDAKPDGYTMLSMHEAILSNQISGMVDYSVESFEFVGIGVISRSMTLVCNGKKFKNMDELAAYAKEHPGEVVAATEWGGTTHQALLALQNALGVEFNIVDGGSVGDRISGIVGEIYDMTITPWGNVGDYIKSGSMTPILMFNDQVYDAYAEVPVSGDYAVDYVFDKFFGLFMPKDTDEAIVEKCRDILKRVTESPEFAAEVEANDLLVSYIDDAAVFDASIAKLKEYSEKYKVE